MGDLRDSIAAKFDEARPLTAAIKEKFDEVRKADDDLVIKSKSGPSTKLDVATQRAVWNSLTPRGRSLIDEAARVVVRNGRVVIFQDSNSKVIWHEELTLGALAAIDATRSTPEQVNHPAHYGGGDDPYEAIKVIEAWSLGFNLGNAVKYIRRLGSKGDPVEQLRKVAFYVQREIDLRTGTKPAEAVRDIVAGHDAQSYDLRCTKEAFDAMVRMVDERDKRIKTLASDLAEIEVERLNRKAKRKAKR